MRFEGKLIWLGMTILAVAACTAAYEGDTQPFVTGEPTSADLAFSLGGGKATKADYVAVTELASTPAFRGMEYVRVVPFESTTSVSPDDMSLAGCNVLPSINDDSDLLASTDGSSYHKGLIRNNNAHLYPGADATLPSGTSTVLVYGRAVPVEATTPLEDMRFNGALIEAGFSNNRMTASDLTFSPYPILTSAELPAAAQSIADILNAIAQDAAFPQSYYYLRNGVYYSAQMEVRWDQNLGSAELRDAFERFTNVGQLTTGAGENVKYLLTSLYQTITQYENNDPTAYKHRIGSEEFDAVLTDGGTDPLTYSSMYTQLKDLLLSRFNQLVQENLITITGTSVNFVSEDLRSYPVSLGLPAGAAALRWNGHKFVTVAESLDGVAPIDSYCYMPALYYYVQSTVSTSASREIYKQYTYSAQSWDQIVSQYRSGKVVVTSTKSVAIDNALEYANGLLVLTVKASQLNLPDNDGDARTTCEASGTHFPVTGIIVGSQFRQRYDFTPDPSATDEYFSYDSKVSGVYLTTAPSAELRTLVLPTPANTDVYFFIELRNDSGSAFYGAEGIIIPGSHFYLAGKLQKPEGQSQESVFASDYFTTANCVVSTLENAHVSIPEMGDPQLLIGVQTATSWTQSAASYIILE